MAKRKPKSEKQGELFDGGPRVHRRKRDTLKGRKVRRELTTSVCSDALGPIGKGCEIYCLTMGKFSLIDVIEHVLASTGPADVVVSTWTAAGADIGEGCPEGTSNGDGGRWQKPHHSEFDSTWRAEVVRGVSSVTNW